MKFGKRLLAALLVLALAVCSFPVGAFAAETASGTCGDNVTWVFDEATETLTISGSGEMDFGGEPHTPWYGYSLKHVVIEEGVTSVASNAFSYTLIESVSLPDSLLTIGVQAFMHCLNLTSVTIPDHVTEIRSQAFANCTSLLSITVPNSVTLIGESAMGTYAAVAKDDTVLNGFKIYGYSGAAAQTYAESREIPFISLGENVSGYCNANVKWALSSDGTLTVSGSGKMSTGYDGYYTKMPWYYVRESILKVVIGDGITDINMYAFRDCENLTSIDIPDSVTYIDYGAFQNCTSLTSIDIPDSVTNMGAYVFEHSGLTSITIPSGLTSISNGTFAGCQGLTSVTIPSYVTSIGPDAFYTCRNLASVTVENPNCDIYAEIYTLGYPEEVPMEGWIWIVGTVIHGYSGSTAEAYANEYGYEFVALDSKPAPTEPEPTEPEPTEPEPTEPEPTEPEPTEPEPAEPTPSTTSASWKNPYTDVASGIWYYDSVKFVTEQGLMNGMAANNFAPQDTLTRSMLVTILYRYEGSPTISGSMPFKDIASGRYFTTPVLWGAKNGIVNGMTATTFEPNANITREQMVTILHRYAQKKGIDVSAQASLSSFPDRARVSNFAKTAMSWAVAEGIIQGDSQGLRPQGTTTRAEVATVLQRYIENIVEK